MPRVDELIRRELHRLERPVRTDVFDAVAARKRRRRVAMRVRTAALAFAVVAGSVLGTYGLFRVFGPGAGSRPGGAGTPEPSVPPPSAQPTALCDLSELRLDLDGDGAEDDLVEVGAPAAEPGVPCEQATGIGPYSASIVIDAGSDVGRASTQELPECDQPWGCRLFAAPDLDGDGASEVAIRLGFGASTVTFSIYRFDPMATPEGGALVRLEVAEPGDRWDEEFGLAPGPARFLWYGSVTHQHWLSCDRDPERRLAVMTAIRDQTDDRGYLVHGSLLRLEGSSLAVERSWDEEVGERALELPGDLCGAPLLPAG